MVRQLRKMVSMMRKGLLILAAVPETGTGSGGAWTTGYLIGGIAAVLIMGYLVYVLFRPEKF